MHLIVYIVLLYAYSCLFDKKSPYRLWFYFRQGWATYFVFLIGVVNTAVTSYYLAINNIPELKILFPSFSYYMITISIIITPLILLIGYYHFKKTKIYESEIDISVESNPHGIRQLELTETLLFLFVYQNDLIRKLIHNKKLSAEEIEKFKKIQTDLNEFRKARTINWDEISTMIDENYKN